MPWPVTAPMRALISWIDDHEGQAEQHGPGEGVAELRADLAVGGDAAGVVVGGTGDEAGADAVEQAGLGYGGLGGLVACLRIEQNNVMLEGCCGWMTGWSGCARRCWRRVMRIGITAFAAGTRTAADAAAAIGCGVAQIAKSIVFAVADGGGRALGAGRRRWSVASGVNRVDRRRAGAALGGEAGGGGCRPSCWRRRGLPRGACRRWGWPDRCDGGGRGSAGAGPGLGGGRVAAARVPDYRFRAGADDRGGGGGGAGGLRAVSRAGGPWRGRCSPRRG